MKNKLIIAALACSLFALAACSGDRTPQSGHDSVKNSYKVAKDTSKMDTNKAAGADNSASGGASAMKDTAKQAKPGK